MFEPIASLPVSPAAAETKLQITGLRLGEIRQELMTLGLTEKKANYHSHQIFKWLYQRGATSFEQMTDLSKVLRLQLAEKFAFDEMPVITEQKSTDGTRKFLFRLPDGKSIESVLIPANDRMTICISSQVGCAMGCKFCNTASMGLERNLKVHEIVGQVNQLARLLAKETALGQKHLGTSAEKITNIVFMGMGEPLHNLENVACAIEILLSQDGLNFSKRKITVSTSGLVPAIRKLNERLTAENKINLAISLNGSYDEQREAVMPVNKAFNIEALLDACRDWDLGPHRRITFEYVVMGGVNDTLEDAARVEKLLKGIPSKVNVIPYNPHPSSPYARPTEIAVEKFHRFLMDRGVAAMIRHSRGSDILAACGQLKSRVERLVS